MGLKINDHRRANGTLIRTESDGIQKRIFVFLPGNSSDEADAVILTNRWSKRVHAHLPNDDVVHDSAAPYYATKEQIIRRFIRAAMAQQGEN